MPGCGKPAARAKKNQDALTSSAASEDVLESATEALYKATDLTSCKAAVQQLKLLGRQIHVPVFYKEGVAPPELCVQGIDYARQGGADVPQSVDAASSSFTAGRARMSSGSRKGFAPARVMS